MIGLCVVDNHQVDIIEANTLFDLGKKFFSKGGLDGIDQGDFLVPFYNIRIVGGAIVRRKKLIKNLQLCVSDTNPENIVGDFLIMLHNVYRLSF